MKQNSERRLFLFLLEGSRRYFILGILAALLMTFCDMLIPQMLRVTVDSCIGDAEPELPAALSAAFAAAGGRTWLKGHLWAAALAVVLAAALGALFRWFSTLENAKGGEQLVKTAHDRLYSHIVRLPYAWHMSHAAGDIIQRCTSDVNMLKEFCSEQLYNLVRVVLMIALALGFMAAMHTGLTLAVLAFVPLIAGYSTFFMFRVRDQFTQCDENEGLLSAIAQENLTGVRVVRAFGAEAREERKFRAQNDVYTNAWMKLCVYLAWFWAFGDLASGLQVLTVVALGAWLCVHGSLTPGSYLAFISYNGMLVWPIRTLGRMISELSKTEVSMHRIAEILNAEPENTGEIPAAGTFVTASAGAVQAADAHPAGETQAADPVFSGSPRHIPEISFRHVSFSFGTSRVLKDIDFTVPAGSTVGILGSTGCGKSTLMHLLFRLYELPEGNGAILLDGKDIREIPLKELRSQIGIVLQEPFLFSGTIGENIAVTESRKRAGSGNIPGSRNIPESRNDAERQNDAERGTGAAGQMQRAEKLRAEMDRAIRMASLTETLEAFPEGEDTVVGERGVTLSGGQRQRVAIARLLTEHKPVMIFDDSLSAVDAETDSRIRKALREELGEATVFLISHRVSTLMHADRILVMQDGEIAEAGTHEELAARNGLYAKTWRLQSLPEEGGAV